MDTMMDRRKHVVFDPTINIATLVAAFALLVTLITISIHVEHRLTVVETTLNMLMQERKP